MTCAFCHNQLAKPGWHRIDIGGVPYHEFCYDDLIAAGQEEGEDVS